MKDTHTHTHTHTHVQPWDASGSEQPPTRLLPDYRLFISAAEAARVGWLDFKIFSLIFPLFVGILNTLLTLFCANITLEKESAPKLSECKAQLVE